VVIVYIIVMRANIVYIYIIGGIRIMDKEYILFGHKENEPGYMETVLCECKTEKELSDETWKAFENGYITRVLIYTPMEKPIFDKDIICPDILKHK
jgi:hypothetical protein